MDREETIYRQDVLDLAKKGILISNGNYESVCKAINEIPSAEPKTDTWSIKDVANTFKKHGLIVEQEPCEDAISRQAVLDILKREGRKWGNDYRDWVDAIEEIKNLSSVNPTKTGHWIWCIGSHKCSNCEEYTCFSHKELLRYCPNCGCRMVEPQERSDKE